MFPLFVKSRKGLNPLLSYMSSAFSGRWKLFLSVILFPIALSFFSLEESKAANTQVYWGNADYNELDGGFNTPLEFYGLNAAGAGAAKLAKDVVNLFSRDLVRQIAHVQNAINFNFY